MKPASPRSALIIQRKSLAAPAPVKWGAWLEPASDLTRVRLRGRRQQAAKAGMLSSAADEPRRLGWPIEACRRSCRPPTTSAPAPAWSSVVRSRRRTFPISPGSGQHDPATPVSMYFRPRSGAGGGGVSAHDSRRSVEVAGASHDYERTFHCAAGTDARNACVTVKCLLVISSRSLPWP